MLSDTSVDEEQYALMFIVALFTMAKKWKQLKYPWTNE
jgi:hypothetical protein